MSSHAKDVYGGNYPKARRLAIARSGGKCQFCGLRKAKEGHHWAWPDYPSGEEVQGHDITALCETCHELATMLRDWIERKHADFDQIAKEFRTANNFYEKREAFSYWLFPEEDDLVTSDDFHVYQTPAHNPAYLESGDSSSVISLPKVNIEDELFGRQMQLDYNTEIRTIIGRQLGRWNNGESLDSRRAKKDAREIHKWTNLPLHASKYELQLAYDAAGMEMQDDIRAIHSLRNQRKSQARTRKKTSLDKRVFLTWFLVFIVPLSLLFFVASILSRI